MILHRKLYDDMEEYEDGMVAGSSQWSTNNHSVNIYDSDYDGELNKAIDNTDSYQEIEKGHIWQRTP